MNVIAAILFAVGLVLRLVHHAPLDDPWVWAFAGLLALSLAGGVEVGPLIRRRRTTG